MTEITLTLLVLGFSLIISSTMLLLEPKHESIRHKGRQHALKWVRSLTLKEKIKARRIK